MSIELLLSNCIIISKLYEKNSSLSKICCTLEEYKNISKINIFIYF